MHVIGLARLISLMRLQLPGLSERLTVTRAWSLHVHATMLAAVLASEVFLKAVLETSLL
jgi:hypothetical protein